MSDQTEYIKYIVIKRILDEYYPSLKNLTILEPGCGNGNWTARFLKYGSNITGIEIDPDEIRKNEYRNSSAHLVVGKAETVKFRKTFDLVFAKDIIEHIPGDIQFLRNMYDHLKASGRIVVVTENLWSLNWLVQGYWNWLQGRPWKSWEPAHVRFYTPTSLKRKLLSTGFKPLKWFGTYYFPYAPMKERLGIESKKFSIIERLGINEKFPFKYLGWGIGVIAEKL